MTPERIAEIFRLLEALERTNFVAGFDGWVKLVRECLAALEAAQAELAALRGEVVLTEEERKTLLSALFHYGSTCRNAFEALSQVGRFCDPGGATSAKISGDRCGKLLERYRLRSTVPEGKALVDAGIVDDLAAWARRWQRGGHYSALDMDCELIALEERAKSARASQHPFQPPTCVPITDVQIEEAQRPGQSEADLQPKAPPCPDAK